MRDMQYSACSFVNACIEKKGIENRLWYGIWVNTNPFAKTFGGHTKTSNEFLTFFHTSLIKKETTISYQHSKDPIVSNSHISSFQEIQSF